MHLGSTNRVKFAVAAWLLLALAGGSSAAITEITCGEGCLAGLTILSNTTDTSVTYTFGGPIECGLSFGALGLPDCATIASVSGTCLQDGGSDELARRAKPQSCDTTGLFKVDFTSTKACSLTIEFVQFIEFAPGLLRLKGGGGSSSSCSDCNGTLVPVDCVTPVCGNGVLEPTEECDDGNLHNGDGCSDRCKLEIGCCHENVTEFCGFAEPERCPLQRPAGGNCTAAPEPCCTDSPSNTTVLADPSCCEAVGFTPGSCPDLRGACCQRCIADGGQTVVSSLCRNGVLQGDCVDLTCEQQEVPVSSFSLNGVCNASFCGPPSVCNDTVVNAAIGEDCDDGNNADHDGCSANCKNESKCCFTSFQNPVGCVNTTAATCTGTVIATDVPCLSETCCHDRGGGLFVEVEVDPQCCEFFGEHVGPCPVCGDGILGFNEECDDGNNEDNDGCSASCRNESKCCWSSLQVPAGCVNVTANQCTEPAIVIATGVPCLSEPCCINLGHGNFVELEVDPQCCEHFGEHVGTCPVCGDGVIGFNEECDDGNDASDDGCSSNCRIEDGWSCTGEPSICCPPDTKENEGACCLGGPNSLCDFCSCVLCTNSGYNWTAPGVTCEERPCGCPPPGQSFGACTYVDPGSNLTVCRECDCNLCAGFPGSTFLGDNAECPAPGACCAECTSVVGTPSPRCFDVTPDQCNAQHPGFGALITLCSLLPGTMSFTFSDGAVCPTETSCPVAGTTGTTGIPPVVTTGTTGAPTGACCSTTNICTSDISPNACPPGNNFVLPGETCTSPQPCCAPLIGQINIDPTCCTANNWTVGSCPPVTTGTTGLVPPPVTTGTTGLVPPPVTTGTTTGIPPVVTPEGACCAQCLNGTTLELPPESTSCFNATAEECADPNSQLLCTQGTIPRNSFRPNATCIDDFTCPAPVCGNGVLEAGEECDDGNTQSGDGCSSTCQTEVPPVVTTGTTGIAAPATTGTTGLVPPPVTTGTTGFVPPPVTTGTTGGIVLPENCSGVGGKCQNSGHDSCIADADCPLGDGPCVCNDALIPCCLLCFPHPVHTCLDIPLGECPIWGDVLDANYPVHAACPNGTDYHNAVPFGPNQTCADIDCASREVVPACGTWVLPPGETVNSTIGVAFPRCADTAQVLVPEVEERDQCDRNITCCNLRGGCHRQNEDVECCLRANETFGTLILSTNRPLECAEGFPDLDGVCCFPGETEPETGNIIQGCCEAGGGTYHSAPISPCVGCGNGIIDPGEECDDGNTNPGDGCSANCTVESGWFCNEAEPTGCSVRPCCESQFCELRVNCPGELRPPGNICRDCHCWLGLAGSFVSSDPVCCVAVGRIPGDDCPPPPLQCGDAYTDLAAGEECDDFNQVSGDGCSANCTIEHGYTCTFALIPLIPGFDTLLSQCTSTCGDGFVADNEECDDNNTIPGDGCSDTCTIEPGFNCTGEPSVCSPNCGNGIVEDAEECDDGNNVDHDGCSSGCLVEEACCLECEDTNFGSDVFQVCANLLPGQCVNQTALEEQCAEFGPGIQFWADVGPTPYTKCVSHLEIDGCLNVESNLPYCNDISDPTGVCCLNGTTVQVAVLECCVLLGGTEGACVIALEEDPNARIIALNDADHITWIQIAMFVLLILVVLWCCWFTTMVRTTLRRIYRKIERQG